MSVRFPRKYYFILIVIAVLSAIALYLGTSHIDTQDKDERKERLELANRDAVRELHVALSNYATLISGLKSYSILTEAIPPKEIARDYINNQLKDLEHVAPFCISFVDINHIVQYDFPMQDQKHKDVSGMHMKKFIGNKGVSRMDSLMREPYFFTSNPINLMEGKVGLQLGFGILNGNGESLGYLTSIATLGTILNNLYNQVDTDKFVFKFQSDDKSYFDRTRTYNGQEVFAEAEDPEFFKNFDVSDDKFISSTFSFYKHNFEVSTAYKADVTGSAALFMTSIIWYLAILSFMIFLTVQYYIYEQKNKLIAGQKEQLTDLVATKNKFFSIIAHDLRSPLSSVINFLDVLKGDKFQNTQTREIMQSLESSSRNSITLLDNLLMWSRLQTGQINFSPTELDVLTITKNKLNVYRDEIERKNLNVRIESTFKSVLIADKNMIVNIVRNLLSNAIKFSKDNAIIVIELTEVDNNFSFSIEDNGIGITKDFQERLFDINENTIQLGTSNEKGSGLGLILTDKFIQVHNGELHIESQPSKGTIVSFTIPLS